MSGAMMAPGRELDALVAEKVMGALNLRITVADWEEDMVLGNGDIWRTRVPDYSTSISAAWQVVEKLDFCVVSRGGTVAKEMGGWEVDCEMNGQHRRAFAATAPHAICLAALKAVECEVPA